MTGVITWVVDCGDGVCIHLRPMTLSVFTNFQVDTITGIRDADFAKESLIDDMMTGVRDVGGTAGPGGTGSNIMNPLDQMGFTNLGNDVVTNDLQTSWQGSLDKMPWDLFRPAEGNAKETGEFHLQSENYCTGYCFAEENAEGYTEVEWTVFVDDVGVTATQLQENFANGTFVKGGQLGYTEVEWTYLTNEGSSHDRITTGLDEDNVLRSDNRFAEVPVDLFQGLDAGGMNYAEAVGLDSSTFDVVNNLNSICGGCGRHGTPWQADV